MEGSGHIRSLPDADDDKQRPHGPRRCGDHWGLGGGRADPSDTPIARRRPPPASGPVNRSVHTDCELRQRSRLAVMAIRPIALRRVDLQDQPGSPWQLADILDISLDGLCLIVSGMEPHPVGLRLQLDLRNHPAFGTARRIGEVRWCSSFHGFTTMGLAFLTPLARIPRLEPDGPRAAGPATHLN